MTQISKLTSVDPRSNWDKLSRRQCWAGAKKLGIPYKAGQKHSEMVQILMNAGVTPEQVVEFKPMLVKDGNGDQRVVMTPDQPERVFDEQKEHRRLEVFEQRIADGIKIEEERSREEKAKLEKEKDTEINGLKTELEDLKAMMQKLLEQNSTVPHETSVKKITDPLKMHWKSFQKMAKEVGIEWSTKDPREPVIEKLEATNV